MTWNYSEENIVPYLNSLNSQNISLFQNEMKREYEAFLELKERNIDIEKLFPKFAEFAEKNYALYKKDLEGLYSFVYDVEHGKREFDNFKAENLNEYKSDKELSNAEFLKVFSKIAKDYTEYLGFEINNNPETKINIDLRDFSAALEDKKILFSEFDKMLEQNSEYLEDKISNVKNNMLKSQNISNQGESSGRTLNSNSENNGEYEPRGQRGDNRGAGVYYSGDRETHSGREGGRVSQPEADSLARDAEGGHAVGYKNAKRRGRIDGWNLILFRQKQLIQRLKSLYKVECNDAQYEDRFKKINNLFFNSENYYKRDLKIDGQFAIDFGKDFYNSVGTNLRKSYTQYITNQEQDPETYEEFKNPKLHELPEDIKNEEIKKLKEFEKRLDDSCIKDIDEAKKAYKEQLDSAIAADKSDINSFSYFIEREHDREYNPVDNKERYFLLSLAKAGYKLNEQERAEHDALLKEALSDFEKNYFKYSPPSYKSLEHSYSIIELKQMDRWGIEPEYPGVELLEKKQELGKESAKAETKESQDLAGDRQESQNKRKMRR